MQLALQKVPVARGYDLITDEPKITLKFLKDLTITNGGEMTALTQDGTPLTHFDHSASFVLSGTSAVIDDGLMSLQLGSDIEVLVNTNEIRISETVEVTTNSAQTTHVATGVVGAELKYVEVLDSSDNVIEKFEQMTGTVTTKKFTYDFATKTITFFAGDLTDKTRVRLHYFPTIASVRRLRKLITNSSATLRWECDAIFKDVCNSQEMWGQLIVPKGHLDMSFEWATAEASDGASHNFSITGEATCQKHLFDFVNFKESDIS